MASNTDFVENKIKPLLRRYEALMAEVSTVVDAYAALGGADFIAALDGDVVAGYTDLQRVDIVDGMYVVQVAQNAWQAGGNSSVARAVYKE